MDENWLKIFSGVENISNLTDSLSACPINETDLLHSTWVFKYFGECVLNVRQYIAFFIGMLSIACWFFAQVPQLVTNCRTGQADKALSFWFLIQWLLGDTTNLVGAILTNQLAPQIATAVYFVLIDALTLGQFLYYVVKNQGCKGLLNCLKCNITKRPEPLLAALLPGMMCSLFLATGGGHQLVSGRGDLYLTSSRSGRVLLGLDGVMVVDPHDGRYLVGYILGCFSAMFYVCSRVPQIVKNFMRCSVEGLSLYMFILAVLGNTTYGLGIFLYSVEPVFLLRNLPWLVGSVGTLAFDFLIVFQFVSSQWLGYRCKHRPAADGADKRPLMCSVGDGDLEDSVEHHRTQYGTV